MTTWRNWARTAEGRPVKVATPDSAQEVSALIAEAATLGVDIRMVGAGHSFTATAATNGVLLRPDRLTGVSRVDDSHVKVRAGTTLTDLCHALDDLGLALPNMGDIRVQTLAGATATGTHGTGRRFASLASGITALELVLADGSVTRVDADTEPELFESARVGLGAFGIITAIELEVVPAFVLQAHEFPSTLSETLAKFDEWENTHDHVEFYWFPHTDKTLVKQNDRTEGPAEPLSGLRGWWDDEFLSNTLFGAVCRAGRSAPKIVPLLNRVSGSALSERSYADTSWKVFTSPRRVRFAEMEYALPRAALKPALTELNRLIENGDDEVSFPVEVRTGPAEPGWLALAHDRDTVYVATHMFQRVPYERFFAQVEDLWRQHDGRPHWGKLHTRTAEEFAGMYPRFDTVTKVRDRVDPERRFTNEYLARVLGD